MAWYETGLPYSPPISLPCTISPHQSILLLLLHLSSSLISLYFSLLSCGTALFLDSNSYSSSSSSSSSTSSFSLASLSSAAISSPSFPLPHDCLVLFLINYNASSSTSSSTSSSSP